MRTHHAATLTFIHIATLAILLAPILSSCSDDTGDEGREEIVNVNANASGTISQRTEMPHIKGGTAFPVVTKDDPTIGVNYTLEWDCLSRAQHWVCYEWTALNSQKGWERKNWENTEWLGKHWSADPFQPDPSIDEQYRTELSDYRGSGYDRGHMVASEDRICSQNVNGQTFYLTNMHPQVNAFNARVWATMEARLRTWRDVIVNAGGTLYICKGGTIGSVTLGGRSVAGTLDKNPVTGASNAALRMPVPKYFFMAVVKKTAAGLYSGMAFWAEHKADNSKDLTPYMISIEELERRTGFDFFCNLPDAIEEPMERGLDTSLWK